MVTCFPIAEKQKSVDICGAFAKGCGGRVAFQAEDVDGPAFFYGVDSTNESSWHAAKKSPHGYFYCDNSYFDETRQRFFRVTRNRLQHAGIGASDCRRFKELGIEVRPWHQERGEYVVVCAQSGHFMRLLAGVDYDWLGDVLTSIRTYGMAVRLRDWASDKGKLARSLPQDLQKAQALITWSSAAAVTSVIHGVPVVCADTCAAYPMAGSLHELDSLPRRERGGWLGVLADNQWTLDEFRDGTAWRMLQ